MLNQEAIKILNVMFWMKKLKLRMRRHLINYLLLKDTQSTHKLIKQ